MSNLRECVQSAADVVSTASSTLTVDVVDRTSVRHGSDFGDVFLKDTNETMLRWMSSNTVYEFEDMVPHPDPSEASTGDAITEYQSDSDSDLETEMIKALFKSAKMLKEDGDLHGAGRKLRNCLTRLSTTASTVSLTSLKNAAASGVSKLEVLELLLDTYCILESWSKAQQVMAEKLSITEKQVGKKDELYLWETLKLAELMAKSNEYDAAQLQGRRSLRGFKKLGEAGYYGYEQCVLFLIKLCNSEELVDEEEAYAALLASHQAKVKAKSSPPPANEVYSTRASLPSHDSQAKLAAPNPQTRSESTQSSVLRANYSEKQREQEADQQGPIKDNVRSLRPKDSLTLLRDRVAISVAEASSNANVPAIFSADDNSSDAPGASDPILRRSVSDTQLVHDASSSVILPSMLVANSAFEISPGLGKHRRSVSDSPYSLFLPGTLSVLVDEQASNPIPVSTPSRSSSRDGRSTPSTIRRMRRDSLENLATTSQVTKWTVDKLLALACPVCDEDLAGRSEENRMDHVNSCFDDFGRANVVTSIPERPDIGKQEAPNSTLYAFMCPVCEKNLAGWSEEMKSTHVNACLDGPAHVDNLPSTPSSFGLILPTLKIGTWACKICRSEVLESLKIHICGRCGCSRTGNDPCSLNDFETIDHFRILLTSPLDLHSLRAMDGSLARRKVFLMGDACCGKTWLAR
jgi:hypothetical protein